MGNVGFSGGVLQLFCLKGERDNLLFWNGFNIGTICYTVIFRLCQMVFFGAWQCVAMSLVLEYMTTSENEILTVDQVAEMLQVSRSTIYTFIADKDHPLPVFYLSTRTPRFRKKEVETWIAEKNSWFFIVCPIRLLNKTERHGRKIEREVLNHQVGY